MDQWKINKCIKNYKSKVEICVYSNKNYKLLTTTKFLT